MNKYNCYAVGLSDFGLGIEAETSFIARKTFRDRCLGVGLTDVVAIRVRNEPELEELKHKKRIP
jgi:hypothetical protein